MVAFGLTRLSGTAELPVDVRRVMSAARQTVSALTGYTPPGAVVEPLADGVGLFSYRLAV